MKYWKICLVVAILAGVVGCGKQLTREKAAEMIIKHKGFPIPVGVRFSLYDNEEKQALEAAGLTKATKKGATLTDEGRKYFVKDFFGPHFKVCEQVFVEVTGIRKSEDGTHAEVEYTWKYDNLTEVAKVAESVNEMPSYYRNEKPHKTSVYFALYDDGWRIE